MPATRVPRWVWSGRNLLVSFLNAMGVSATTFGNPAYCTGPLPNLT